MSSSSASNGTIKEPEWCNVNDPTQFVFQPMVYSLVFSIGLPGNIIAMVVFLRNGKIRKAIRIYLINLTMADILFNLTLPLWSNYYFHRGNWTILNDSVLSDMLCRLAGATYYLSTYSAITFMMLISINRYCTIQMPKRRFPLNTLRGALTTSLVTWIVWIGCAVPSLLEQQTFHTNYSVTKCFEQFSGSQRYSYAIIVYVCISFLVVLVCYLSIIKPLSSPQSCSHGTHRRLAKSMVLGMLLVFVICIAPYHLTVVAWVASRSFLQGCKEPSALDIMHRINISLLSLNSCIDPLIYCFSVKRFRNDLLKMWQKFIHWLPLHDTVHEAQESHIKSSSFTSS